MSRCSICGDPECYESAHEKPCPSCGATLLVQNTKAYDEVLDLRAALAEALTAWESWCADQQHTGMDASVFDRIAELRKLTRHGDEEG